MANCSIGNKHYSLYKRCSKAFHLYNSGYDGISNLYSEINYEEMGFRNYAFNSILHNEYWDNVSRDKEFVSDDGEFAIADMIFSYNGNSTLVKFKFSTEKSTEEDLEELAWISFVADKNKIFFNEYVVIRINGAFVKTIDNCFEDEILMYEYSKSKVDSKKLVIKKDIIAMRRLLAIRDRPDITKGWHCLRPDNCPFMEYCFNENSNKSTSKLSKINDSINLQYRWKGITQIEDIPTNSKLSKEQWDEIEIVKKKELTFDKASVKEHLKSIASGEVWFLSIDSKKTFLPMAKGLKVFSEIPFNYFLIFSSKETGIQSEFSEICENPLDTLFLKTFAIKLITTLSYKPLAKIVVYNKFYVLKLLDTIENCFVEFKEDLKNIRDRLLELKPIFENYMYYHPKFNCDKNVRNILLKMCPEIIDEEWKCFDATNYKFRFFYRERDKEKAKLSLVAHNAIYAKAYFNIVRLLQLGR